MLQVLWGDDEHTAAESAYSRSLKARKWVLILGITALALAYRYVKIDEVNKLLKVISIPESILRQSLLIGLTYILIQYGILLFQLVRTYEIILRDRLSRRRIGEIDLQRAHVEELQHAADQWRARATGHDDSLRYLDQALRDERKEDAERRVKAAKARLNDLLASDPTRKMGFVSAERVIDALRVGSPLIFGLTAHALLSLRTLPWVAHSVGQILSVIASALP